MKQYEGKQIHGRRPSVAVAITDRHPLFLSIPTPVPAGAYGDGEDGEESSIWGGGGTGYEPLRKISMGRMGGNSVATVSMLCLIGCMTRPLAVQGAFATGPRATFSTLTNSLRVPAGARVVGRVARLGPVMSGGGARGFGGGFGGTGGGGGGEREGGDYVDRWDERARGGRGGQGGGGDMRGGGGRPQPQGQNRRPGGVGGASGFGRPAPQKGQPRQQARGDGRPSQQSQVSKPAIGLKERMLTPEEVSCSPDLTGVLVLTQPAAQLFARDLRASARRNNVKYYNQLIGVPPPPLHTRPLLALMF